MKKILLFLFSLVCIHTYADDAGCTRNIIANYSIPTQTITTLPQTIPYGTLVGQQIIGNCILNIFVRSDFIPNSTLLSSEAPFSLKNNNFQITGGGPGLNDSVILSNVKNYIMQNFKITTLAFKDNFNSPTPPKIIVNSSTTYNIIPDTSSSNFTVENNGELYYRGNQGAGQTSSGMRLNQFAFSFDHTKPSASVISALQNATLEIPLGNLLTKYFISGSSSDITTTNTAVILKLTINFTLPTCAVDVPATLDIGSTTIQTLETNSFSNNTPFQLKIICSAAIPNRTFKLTVQDANDLSNINTTGILKIQPGLANPSNVAIRLMNGSSPFSIGSPFNYATTGTSPTQTQFIYTPSAQLFKISSPVTLGNVAGKARFFLDYD
ncbi:hypothetical protein B9T31_16735 [Acinetobacter sp. ANC 4558]|uniref:fimbrial protein n=1 Tax=Acinetobacter sp. ANC 4558 TaxID=1977876 RepID=UPI000A343564|nr:fimbrial protein [Acinetobacter sp. ANC 4558]OTG79773.1 hypothetical protein B9T31_16735 [Acinetobacter sp. ANC 4558]